MTARKKKTVPQLIDQAAVLLQKIVRMEAADGLGNVKCVTCGAVKNWKEMQGGHFISRTWTSTKLMKENLHPQCQRCNGPLKGNNTAYTLYMLDMYGREFVDEMLLMKHQTKKYTRAEAEMLIDEFKERIKELERYVR